MKKQFPLTFITIAVITLLLILFKFAEPAIENQVKDFFSSYDPQSSGTAVNLLGIILKVFKLVLWMALVITIVRFLNTLIFSTALRNVGSGEISSLLRNTIAIIIYVIAFFTITKSLFNQDLTPLLAGSTIIAVVIGLALQDTLGNLFSGLALQADQPLQVGDVVNIPNKGTGIIEEISWRGLKIRTFQNRLIIISNANLGKEAIEVAPKNNLNARIVSFSTLYSDSPAKTIHAVREAVRQVENVSPKIRPVVRIRNLGDSGLEWEVKYWAEDYAKHNETDGLIRQRIWYVFQREKIEFAYPTRTIYVENKQQEDAFVEVDSAIFDRLSDVSLFAPLNDDETQKLAKQCLVRVFAPGEAIVRKGQKGGSMFIVHRGSVNIQILDNKEKKIVSVLSEGDIFGEMGLFTGEDRSADVVAVEEAEVLEVNNAAVKPLLQDNPNLITALSETIAERRAALDKQLAESESGKQNESKSILSSIKDFFGLK